MRPRRNTVQIARDILSAIRGGKHIKTAAQRKANVSWQLFCKIVDSLAAANCVRVEQKSPKREQVFITEKGRKLLRDLEGITTILNL